MVSMGTVVPSPNDAHSYSDEEEGEEAVGKGAELNARLKWLHEFVTLSLPGSRHQVSLDPIPELLWKPTVSVGER